MREQHLSDEAIAAFADDVLGGSARERARRHTTSCPECNYAVAVQREAVWALRAAPAPALPIGLLDRLRALPGCTSGPTAPTQVDAQSGPMFASFGTASLVPAPRSSRSRRGHTVALTAASIALVGALAGTAVVEMGSGGTAVDSPAPASDRAPGNPALVAVVSPFRPW